MLFKTLWYKMLGVFISILTALGMTIPCLPVAPDGSTEYTNVLVNGLMGWGESDFYYPLFPYWGVMNGDMVSKLRNEGYDVVAASVDGLSGTWDRTCELYAQLTGTVTDYGAAHAAEHGHDRYGKDYSKACILNHEWNSENKINLYGHSFGGATVRMLAYLMENGSEAELAATTDGSISALFTGGKGDYIYAVIALSAPHNGTSAYECTQWVEDDGTCLAKLKMLYSEIEPMGVIFDMIAALSDDENGNTMPGTAHYELHIDGAAELNETLDVIDDAYYFSVATISTKQNEDGTWESDVCDVEPMFYTHSIAMGKTSFVTEGGIVIDESWWPNDGIVNVISARYPFNEPHTEFNPETDAHPEKGIWNVLPDYVGDHTAFMGDLLLCNDASDYFRDLFDMINAL